MRIILTNLSCMLAVLAMLFSAAGDASAQSNTKRKGGFFQRLREKPQPSSNNRPSRTEVESVLEKAKVEVEEESSEDMVKKAASALSENKDDLLKQGQKLLSDNPDALSQATKLMKDGDLLKQATQQAEQLVGAEKMEAAAALAQKQLNSENVSKLARAATSQPQLAPLVPKVASTSVAAVQPAALQGMNRLQVPPPVPAKANPKPNGAVDSSKVTQITADQSKYDQKANIVTFEGNVELDHPQFDLSCDTLEVQMPQSAEGGGGDPTQQAASGGIDKAIARGYVVIEKLKLDGTPQIAIARRAVYDAVSGNIVLTDFPQLQDGRNIIVGKTEATRIYLRPDSGEYDVKGPANYTLDTKGKGLDIKKR